MRHIGHNEALDKAEQGADHIQADEKQEDFPDFSKVDAGASCNLSIRPLNSSVVALPRILGPTMEKMVLPPQK